METQYIGQKAKMPLETEVISLFGRMEQFGVLISTVRFIRQTLIPFA
jgi:hypothetical protein